MTLPYLNAKRWTEISREERLFCAELYFMWSRMPSLKPVITWLNDHLEGRVLPEDEEWHVGFEVCFYRDYINHFLMDGTPSIRDKKVPGTDRPFMVKRTFDLALLHPDHIVIIEAKSKEGISEKQLDTFEQDKEDLLALFKHNKVDVPQVHLILLSTEHYSQAIRSAVPRKRFNGNITWKEVADKAPIWGADAQTIHALLRADSLMGKTK